MHGTGREAPCSRRGAQEMDPKQFVTRIDRAIVNAEVSHRRAIPRQILEAPTPNEQQGDP
jgi:hypothetical protein